jgi:DNA-binding IclR family transcriptional regulator
MSVSEDSDSVEVAFKRPVMLQTLQRAVAVMDLLAKHSPLTAQQISEKLDLERTIVHRLVRTLESELLVERDGARLSLGPRHLQFANSFVGHQGLRQACLPYQVEFLYRTFAGEPWSLALLIRVGRTVTLVSHLVSPTAPLQSLLAVAAVIRIEDAAAGRCMLAYESDEEVAAIVGESVASELRPRLARIRDEGGVDYVRPSERAGAPPDLSALAVCIRSRSGKPVGALTISGAQLDQHLSADSAPATHLRAIAQHVGQVLS